MRHSSAGEGERPAVSGCYCGLCKAGGDSALPDREGQPLLRVPAHPEENRGEAQSVVQRHPPTTTVL